MKEAVACFQSCLSVLRRAGLLNTPFPCLLRWFSPSPGVGGHRSLGDEGKQAPNVGILIKVDGSINGYFFSN